MTFSQLSINVRSEIFKMPGEIFDRDFFGKMMFFLVMPRTETEKGIKGAQQA